MRPAAIQISRDEHLAIAAVLYSLRYLARRIRDKEEEPNHRLLHAMLDYIVEYPDRWHHPKESDYVFRAVRERNPKAADLVAELEKEHMQGDRLIEELKEKLIRLEHGETDARALFAKAVEQYAQFQWEHIRKEEDFLLPIAEESLTTEDWQRIAAAFRETDNPLFGIKPKDEAERLYQTILDLAPPPIGVERGKIG
jgi:hemerythrin-like domain-containing protein